MSALRGNGILSKLSVEAVIRPAQARKNPPYAAAPPVPGLTRENLTPLRLVEPGQTEAKKQVDGDDDKLLDNGHAHARRDRPAGPDEHPRVHKHQEQRVQDADGNEGQRQADGGHDDALALGDERERGRREQQDKGSRGEGDRVQDDGDFGQDRGRARISVATCGADDGQDGAHEDQELDEAEVLDADRRGGCVAVDPVDSVGRQVLSVVRNARYTDQGRLDPRPRSGNNDGRE